MDENGKGDAGGKRASIRQSYYELFAGCGRGKDAGES